MKYSIFGIKTSQKVISFALCTALTASIANPAYADHTPAPGASSSTAATSDNLSKEQKALQQTLSPEQPVGTGRTEISSGHVDMGPRFTDGKFQLMIHDDHAATPIWRSVDDVLYRGSDAARRQVPDDDRYSFVGAQPGEQVYVIPQTETKGVVWPGWTTQDPGLVQKTPRGVTLTLEQVQGPGQFTLYLENGNFSKPQVLWDSSKHEPQDIWVEKNTHTHANWVFTKPGAYLLKITARAELADGSVVSDTRYMKFAIGDSVTADEVYTLAQQAADQAPTGESEGAHSAAASDSPGASSGGFPVLPVALGAGAVVVLAAAGLFMMRRNKTAQAQAERIMTSGKGARDE